MFSVNSNSTAPHIYQGAYPSYPVYPQHAGLTWNHVQSFGGDHRSFTSFPSVAMQNQFNPFQQSNNVIASFSNPASHNWSYVPQTPMRSIPSPSPNVYASYNLGAVNPSPLYSSHSSIGGGAESTKSDLYSSSSSLNNGGIRFSSLGAPGEQPSSLTHSATFPKQEPAKKPSSRIHDTPAAAGLRNAVLNSDQAQEYFRMKQSGGLQCGGTRNLKKSTQEQTSVPLKQNSSEMYNNPTKNSLSSSGIPSPWAKSSPGSSGVLCIFVLFHSLRLVCNLNYFVGTSNQPGVSPSNQPKASSITSTLSQNEEAGQSHPSTEKSLPSQGGNTSGLNLQFSHLEYRESPSPYRDSLPFGVQKRADLYNAVRIADSEIGYLC